MIDISKPLVLYPGGIEAIRQRVRTSRINGVRLTHVLAYFDKNLLMALIPDNGITELTVVGQLTTGLHFYGTDSVLIVERVGREWDDGSNDPNDGGGGDDGKDNPKDDDKDDKNTDKSGDKDADDGDTGKDQSGTILT